MCRCAAVDPLFANEFISEDFWPEHMLSDFLGVLKDKRISAGFWVGPRIFASDFLSRKLTTSLRNLVDQSLLFCFHVIVGFQRLMLLVLSICSSAPVTDQDIRCFGRLPVCALEHADISQSAVQSYCLTVMSASLPTWSTLIIVALLSLVVDRRCITARENFTVLIGTSVHCLLDHKLFV